MRFELSYLLWILFAVFGALYFVCEIYEVVYGSYVPFKALSRSLFASMIGVLLIKEIVTRRELQKSERSMRFIKSKLAHYLSSLNWFLSAPVDWSARATIV